MDATAASGAPLYSTVYEAIATIRRAMTLQSLTVIREIYRQGFHTEAIVMRRSFASQAEVPGKIAWNGTLPRKVLVEFSWNVLAQFFAVLAR